MNYSWFHSDLLDLKGIDLNQIPYSGISQRFQKCSSLDTMIKQQMTTGGVTGRGVTPCPFGYIQTKNEYGFGEYTPFSVKIVPEVLVQDYNRPGYLPPQGTMRPLTRVGNTYRNCA